MAMMDQWAETAVLNAFGAVRQGVLTVKLPDGRVRTFGNGRGREASIDIHAPRFFTQVVTGGEVALGDTYMDGWWSSPDLVSLVALMLENRDVLGKLPAWLSWVSRTVEMVAHRMRDNSRSGSVRNIHEHYDLGNDFFSLFLDSRRQYSCAVYDAAHASLEAAQLNKLRVICDQLELRPGDRLLEIGTGWGGLAAFAAEEYGCHVTTTTISPEQYAYASQLFAQKGLGWRIDLRLEDYRDLKGTFDKIVSVEMFEAVGLKHYDDFFGACDRLLSPSGAMLMQTITVDDWRFKEYLSTPSWIAKRIFPGSELASVSEILQSLARVGRLGLHHAQEIGPHYALTLREWRARFWASIDDVRDQGFDERFIRMWDLYLAYCEAAFQEGHIGNVQLMFTKTRKGRLVTLAQPESEVVAAAK